MLTIEKLSKTFYIGTVNENSVINDLDLKINEGDFISIIGGNGAGKSTLLNLIAGVHFPEAGRISLDSNDVTRLAEHKRAKYISRVFQDPLLGTAGEMSIAENLAMAKRKGKRRGLSWWTNKEEEKEFKELLKTLDLGLEQRIQTKVKLLSGGQRQALSLIMATMTSPRLLLLDEHTAALDPKTAATIMHETERIVNEKKLTTLMITHNMRHAIEYGNRLIMMNKGRIVLDISGEKKKELSVQNLLSLFQEAVGEEMTNDRMLLQ